MLDVVHERDIQGQVSNSTDGPIFKALPVDSPGSPSNVSTITYNPDGPSLSRQISWVCPGTCHPPFGLNLIKVDESTGTGYTEQDIVGTHSDLDVHQWSSSSTCRNFSIPGILFTTLTPSHMAQIVQT